MKMGKIVVIVSVVIRDKKGRVFLLRRSARNKTFRGCWQLPEGKMEFGEQAEETLERELREELGLRVAGFKFMFTFSTAVKINKESYHLLRIVFLADCKGVPVLKEDQHDAYKWVSSGRPLRGFRFVNGTEEVLVKLGKEEG